MRVRVIADLSEIDQKGIDELIGTTFDVLPEEEIPEECKESIKREGAVMVRYLGKPFTLNAGEYEVIEE